MQILRSSAIVGGSTVINIAIGIIRTKLMAVLLGPAGVGLMGALASVADLARSVAGMGINRSGVRQIAEAAATGDQLRIVGTATVLRRTAWVLGLIGACAVVLLSGPIAETTFGDARHAQDVALLSLVVLFGLLAEALGALLQGLRRITDLAKAGVIGTALGAALSVALVYAMGERGVVPSLIALAAVGALVSWWYARKVDLPKASLGYRLFALEAKALLRLGLAFMASGLLMMGASYAARIIVINDGGLPAAGLYQAAWTLGGLYVGFILQAMGTDFYPRLVAAATDHPQCNRLVNEQATVSVLLAGPGVIATLALAPAMLSIFYSAPFEAAAEVLRWICAGMALRVVTWPMGFIIVAKNHQLVFIATEFAWTVVNVGLTWLFVRWYGIEGSGAAFFASYVFHAVMIYPICRRMTGFSWSRPAFLSIVVFLLLGCAVFAASRFLLPLWALVFSLAMLSISVAYSARSLALLVDSGLLPSRLRRLLRQLRLVGQ